MKKWILTLIILVPLLSLIGCSDSNDDEREDIIKVSDSELNFKAEGEKRSITIMSNAQWEIIVADNTRCKVNPLKGNIGTTVVTVEVSGNTEKTVQTTQLTIKT
ncbi:MAG: BACON domain-containing protein, partial [Prevotella sp.]|nr:BACON domain-containing protein [Prevotella sp.]